MAHPSGSRPHHAASNLPWHSWLLQCGLHLSKWGSQQPRAPQPRYGAVPGLPEPSSLGPWKWRVPWGRAMWGITLSFCIQDFHQDPPLLTACPSLLPQTLLMDRTRLQELESQLHQLTILASVLLVASSFSGSVLFGSPQFVDKLKRITKALMEEFNSRWAAQIFFFLSRWYLVWRHRQIMNDSLHSTTNHRKALWNHL